MKKVTSLLPKIFILLFLNFGFLTANATIKQGKALVDSLMGQLPGMKEDTNKVILLNSLSWAYQYVNPDSGIKYGNMALELALKQKTPKRVGIAYNNIGTNYIDKSDYTNAMVYFDKAMHIFKQIGDKKHLGRIYGNMGNVALYQSDYPKALENYFKVLEIEEELGDENTQIYALGDIGVVYHAEFDYDKSLNYYFKALKLAEKVNNKSSQMTNLGNIGNVYEDQFKYDSALKYFTESLVLSEKLHNKRSESVNLCDIGELHYKQHQYDTALSYCYRSMKVAEQVGFKNGLGVLEEIVGSIYLAIAKDTASHLLDKYFSGDKQLALQRATSSLDSAVIILKKLQDLNHLKNAYLSISETDKLLEDYKGAYYNYVTYSTIKDSLFSDANRKKISLVEKERDEYIAQKKEAEEARHRNILMLGIALFILTFVSVVILLGKWKVHHTIVRILGVFGLLMMFEFIYLIIEPYITQWTNDNPIYTLSTMVGIAAIIVPTHHSLEHKMKELLAKRYNLIMHHGQHQENNAGESSENHSN